MCPVFIGSLKLGLARTLFIHRICRVGQNHIYMVYIRYFFAGILPNIRSYTMYIYGSGQPYVYDRIFGNVSSRNIAYTPYTYIVLANPVYSVSYVSCHSFDR